MISITIVVKNQEHLIDEICQDILEVSKKNWEYFLGYLSVVGDLVTKFERSIEHNLKKYLQLAWDLFHGKANKESKNN